MRPHHHFLLFGGFLFILLPFACIPVTQDPETTLRFLLISSFMVLFSIWMFQHLRTEFTHIEIDPITLSFAAFFIISLLSTTKSVNIGDALFEVGKTGIWLFVLMFFTILLNRTKNKKNNLPLLILISALIFLSFGMYQYLSIPTETSSSKHSNYIVSFLSNKNFFGETLLLMLPFFLFIGFSNKGVLRLVSLFTILLSFSFIIYVQSIAVYIATFFSLSAMAILIFIFRDKLLKFHLTLKTTFILITILVTSISVPATLVWTGKLNTHGIGAKINAAKYYAQHPDKIFNSDSKNNNNSIYDRAFLIKNSLQIYKEHPVTGSGIGNWKILLPKYGLYGNNFMSIGRVRFEHPHNDYLFILCETGIAGLVCWLIMFCAGFIYALRGIIKNESNKNRWLMICLLSNLIAFGLLSLFSYPKERVFSTLLLVSTFAMIIVFTSAKVITFKLPSKYFFLFAVIFCLFLSFMNFSRFRSEVSLYTAFHYQKKELFPQMQRHMESALSLFHVLDQSGTPLRWHLGQSFYYQGKHQEAFENYLIASKQNPYHMQVLNDLGALYETNGDHINATACFNRVFAINPDFPDSKFNMVAVYFNSGETENAYNLLNKINQPQSKKWQQTMHTILIAKTEKLVQETQDTVLVEIINGKLKNNQEFLLIQNQVAEKSGRTFERQLELLKSSD